MEQVLSCNFFICRINWEDWLTNSIKISRIIRNFIRRKRNGLGWYWANATPISGKSGKAYMGSYPDGKRVFIKMNTSPILPGLARANCTTIALEPSFTRRPWYVRSGMVDRKILTPSDMNRKQIIDILTRLHCSRPLMTQLTIGICNGNTFGFTSVMGKQGSGCFKNNQYLRMV